MGIQGLDWQTVQIQLNGGLSTKGDLRIDDPPSMDILKDAEFDDLGGLRTRKPLVTLGIGIIGGGSLANIRRLVANGPELVCFTDTGLYSYVVDSDAWILRGTHLAVKVSEQERFCTSDDQGDCDLARLGEVVVACWENTARTVIYVAAYEAATGAVIMSPTSSATFASGNTRQRPKLVALDSAFLLFCFNLTTGGYEVQAIDPVSVSVGAFTPFGVAPGALAGSIPYDACAIVGADTALFVGGQGNLTTTYQVAKITVALAVTAVSKVRTHAQIFGIAASPDGLHAQVVRSSATSLLGDFLLTSTLADVTINQALGTVDASNPYQFALAYRSVKDSGQYRCYVFWSGNEDLSGFGSYATRVNWVNDAGAIGTASVLRADLGIVSRAFERSGRVYVTLGFAGDTYSGSVNALFSAQSQNTYFLYRDDGLQIAKAAASYAGGTSTILTGAVPGLHVGFLPTVQSIDANTFVFCGMRRRVVATAGDGENALRKYAARAPLEITFTFDSNEARRCVRLGETLYVTGGEILQYDGQQLAELGFSAMPWRIQGSGTGSGGALSAGTYAYKPTWRWDNAKGERDRSSSAAVFSLTVVANDTFSTTLSSPPLRTTRKPNVALELWRTKVNPTADFPFYLVTANDPSKTTNPNRYIENVAVDSLTAEPTFTDTLSDAVVSTNEINPDSEALEVIAPPAATVIAASDTRIFLAGVAGDFDNIWYSKQRRDNQVAGFNDGLKVLVPQLGGASITALAILRGSLIAFRETAVYVIEGDGFDNSGAGQNFGPAKPASYDVGAISAEGVTVGPFGILFKSKKGWYVLNDAHVVQYVGTDVAKFDVEDVLSTAIVDAQHQVRVHTSSRTLVWDYLVNKWTEWTLTGVVTGTLSIAAFAGSYACATPAAVSLVGISPGGGYGMDVELAWMKPAQLLTGAAKVRRFEVLGEYRSGHQLRVRVAYDYEAASDGVWLFRDDDLFTPQDITVGTAEQFQSSPSQPVCEAMKIRITVVGSVTLATKTTGTLSSAPIPTSQGNWNATLRSKIQGVEGNQTFLTVYACVGSGIEVRDHFTFSGTLWQFAPYCVGVRIGEDGQTIAAVEAAINNYSRIIEVSVPDSGGLQPTAIFVDNNTNHTGFFSGGATTQPTGEAVKLSAIGFEIGARRGLYRKLPATQKG